MPASSYRHALIVLRIVAAVLIGIHGVARIWLGIVDDFGVYLNTTGFPLGSALAWLITLVEIIGGAALAAGWLVRPLCLWFVVQLLTGIVLIHAAEGWFTVGAGRNGMEYSVLLIMVFLILAWANVGRTRPGNAPTSEAASLSTLP